MTRTDRMSAPRPGCAPGERPPRPRAFTLVELMVVLIVIAILMTITLGLAARVTEGGKQTLTKNTIRALDQVLTEYKAASGSRPPAWVVTNQTMQNTDGTDDAIDSRYFTFPLVDGRFDGRAFPVIPTGGNANSDRYDSKLDPAQPAVGLFLLLAAEESGGVDAVLKGFDAKIVSRRDVWAYGWALDVAGKPTGTITKRRLRIPVVLDGFGEPVRFVHPSFDGGAADYWDGGSTAARPMMKVDPNVDGAPPGAEDFSRSYRPYSENDPSYQSTWVGDADEGICIGKNPYFYSAGADGDPGTRQDNIYSVEPTFPEDTAGLK